MKTLLPLVLVLLVCATGIARDSHPNVLVILTDDQGWGDCSLNGNTNLRTPELERLAREGATLRHFYACPVCSPTRAEFLTGRYHPRTGVRDVTSGQERLNPDEKTVADAFRAAGYATGAFGKWHNGSQWPYHPQARGFQEYYGFTSGHWGEYFNAPLEHNGTFVRGRGYIADDLTDHALAFMEQHQAEPFFCYLPLNTPHSPFSVPEEYWARQKDNPVALRGALGEKEDVAATRCVLALCENIDHNLGRVLRRLEELHLAEDTIVIYFSDNGPAGQRWNGGMKGTKGGTDEGSVREPFVIRWPGKIPAGSEVREIAGAIDLLPTLASLAGVPLPGGRVLDGVDLSPLLLRRQSAPWPERLIFSTFHGQVGVRSQRWRRDKQGALFDMEADPGQTRNVAAEQPEVAARLSRAVAEWRRDVFGGAEAPSRDDRPFPVGYREFPMTPLPARDGVPHGGIERSAKAPNCSYFVNWRTREGSITWDVEVHTAGEYEAAVWYTCSEGDAGAAVELSLNEARTTARVAPAWDPPLITGEDRAPRRGESTMKEFHPLSLGRLHLEPGRGALTLRALEIPGRSVMDVRMITLTLK